MVCFDKLTGWGCDTPRMIDFEFSIGVAGLASGVFILLFVKAKGAFCSWVGLGFDFMRVKVGICFVISDLSVDKGMSGARPKAEGTLDIFSCCITGVLSFEVFKIQ